MTVFTQAFNLSDNVKYMNFKIDTTPAGGGNATQRTTLADRQEFMHKIQEFITTDRDNQQVPTNKTLGWQRIDGADSAGAIKNDASGVYNENTGNAVYGFMRAKCYDYSSSGHWKYLRLKMFERNEDSLFGTSTGARYRSSPNVLVLRYDVYSDWPGITAEDSAAVIDSINGGSNPAEADGYGGTDLNAGRRNGELYGNQNAPIGFDAAYNANSGYVNDHNGPAQNYWKRSLYGNGNTGLSSPRAKTNNEFANGAYVNNTNIGNYPYGGKRGYGYGHNFYPEFFGVNGFGDSDLSEKNSYGELKLIIDGNGTMWAFGDQDRTGAGGIDSASGTGTHKGVNASGADARYLALFASQHQDDNPEKVDEYATILFAGEYKKEFGEPVSSGYIHNGLKLNAHNFLMNNGVATPPNFKHFEAANWSNSSSNRGVNQVPAASTLANSFYQNFNAGFNTQNAIQGSANYGWHAPSKPLGDAGNTLGALSAYNNNNTAVDMTGHSFMGDEVIDNTAYGVGAAQNRSRSTGSSHRIFRGDNTWKSRNVGNTAYSNSLSNNYGASTYAGQYGAYYPWLGHDGAQFCLTEYPRRTNLPPTDPSQNTSNRREQIQTYDNYSVPASGREMLSATRLHMGYLGYVGHESKYKAFSLNELFFDGKHGMFGDDGFERLGMLSEDEPGDPARHGVVATSGPGLPMVADYYDSIGGNTSDSNSNQREFFQEFHPIPMQDSTFSVYEPVLSVGLSRAAQMAEVKYDNGYNNNTGNSNLVMHSNNGQQSTYITGNFTYGEGGTPGGINKKRSAFAMLGRTYGIKIFGPYTHDKYNFLDAVSVQLDADEFYAVNPNNPVDHWVVPMNHDQVSFLFKK